MPFQFCHPLEGRHFLSVVPLPTSHAGILQDTASETIVTSDPPGILRPVFVSSNLPAAVVANSPPKNYAVKLTLTNDSDNDNASFSAYLFASLDSTLGGSDNFFADFGMGDRYVISPHQTVKVTVPANNLSFRLAPGSYSLFIKCLDGNGHSLATPVLDPNFLTIKAPDISLNTTLTMTPPRTISPTSINRDRRATLEIRGFGEDSIRGEAAIHLALNSLETEDPLELASADVFFKANSHLRRKVSLTFQIPDNLAAGSYTLSAVVFGPYFFSPLHPARTTSNLIPISIG